LHPGDEILTTDHEYGACDYSWEFNCNKSSAKYIHQPLPLPVQSEEQILDIFWPGVTSLTKAIYLSHITSSTALRLPVEKICRLAKQSGILTIIDAAHSPGQIPVDLQKLGADIVFGNCHKWMLAPKGAGFLYVRPEVQRLIEPLIVSWGFDPASEVSTGSRFIDLFQWTGTKDPAAVLTVPTAIDFMKEHNWDEVRIECHRLLRQAMERIADLTHLSPSYPLDSDFYAQMGVAALPPSDPILLKRRLYDDYRIEIPVTEWRDQHFLRISVQAYNSQDDIDLLVKALEVLLPQVSLH
jgi:isopenicillin-N epimerase